MAILPRGQIDCADIRRNIFLCAVIFVQIPHDGKFNDEQHSDGVQIMNRLTRGGITGLDDHKCAVSDNVNSSDDLGYVLRRLAEDERTEYGEQNRQGNELTHGVEEGRDALCEHNERCHADSDCTGAGAVDLADLDTLHIRSLRIDGSAVQVEGKHGRCGVEHRIERGQDRAEQHSGEEAHDRLGNNGGNQCRISEVDRGGTGRRQLVLNGRQMVSDNARQHQIEEADGLEEAAVDRAFLAFLQALCGECALYKGLIRAPPVQVVEEHTREDERPRQSRFSSIPRSPCVELFGFGLYKVLDPLYQTAAGGFVTQQRQREERDHQAADDEADTVDGVGYGNRLQTAEDGVAAADNTDDDTQNRNCCELADAEDTGNIEDILKYNCTGVKDDRQIEDGVHHDDDEREHQLGAAAEACFHQLWDGGRAHFKVGRQEPQRQRKQREQCTDLPADRAHVGSPALTVCADKLFCGQVGQQQRARNDNARQSAPREEVSLGGVELVISGLPR